VTFIKALEDRRLLGQFLDDPSTWRAWFCIARAIDALPPEEGDAELFERVTGRTEWPTEAAREAWIIAGRRSGKSFFTALLATYHAVFKPYKLSAGEVGHVIIVAPTRQQAGIIRKYVGAFFAGNDFLRPLMVRETAGELELSNRITITILSGDYRSLRGYTAVCVVVDEVAFFMSDGATPDTEVIRALRPTVLTTGGRMFFLTTPYSRHGETFKAHRQHFGRNGDPVLVLQAPSPLMNPLLDAAAIERAREEDPEGARAEIDAQFRSDIESFVSREAVDGCIVPGQFELPVRSGVQYFGFVDPSGGSSDWMTLAISHAEDETRVLDLVRERKPPFSPEEVVKDFAADLKRFGCTEVVGDRYGGEWPREQFRKAGIEYIPSETPKSGLYGELLPLLNSGKVELLDIERLTTQLCRLERRTARSGKDSIDHPPNEHDDLINAAAGALMLAQAALGPFLPDVDAVTFETGNVGLGLQYLEIPGTPWGRVD
jgi:hypothetical protein